MPSSLSSHHGRSRVGRLWSHSTGTPESGHINDVHSFNEEEPSFVQGPLRPPSYYEATSQSDRTLGLGNVVHHVWSANTGTITNGTHGSHRSPPPQYSAQAEVLSEVPVRSIVPEPKAPQNAYPQPIARVRPIVSVAQRLDISQEDAQRFENRVRQLQRERAMERRDVATVDGTQVVVGDNHRPQQVATATRRRSNSTDSRNSEQSVQSSQDDEEPVDNDPSVELVRNRPRNVLFANVLSRFAGVSGHFPNFFRLTNS